MAKAVHECTNCGRPVTPERKNYPYTESGLSNVVLQGVEVTECQECGRSDVTIPHLTKVHRVIALALAESPVRLTGEQLRFLRKHLGYTGEQLAKYLSTDKTKISKWERGSDTIGDSTDRLVRLLVAALDKDLSKQVSAIAANLPEISKESGESRVLHINVEYLTHSYFTVLAA